MLNRLFHTLVGEIGLTEVIMCNYKSEIAFAVIKH